MSNIPIKSVQRVFEVLELFNQKQKPLTAKEVADHFGYPLMSAHALLKSMHQLGYADFGAPKWTYIPSRKFIDVLQWARDFLDREQDILNFMDALNEQTQETINLSRPHGSVIKIIHGLETRMPVGVSVQVGIEMPLTNSLTGLTALAGLSETEIDAYFAQADTSDRQDINMSYRAELPSIQSDLHSSGMVMRCDVMLEGVGAICIPILTQAADQPLVLGVVGPSERIRSNEKMLRRTVKKLAGQHNVKTCWPLKV
ncbi:MAG: helix-turn-helix domain-containing protein [Pseudomonadota bacterium]